MSPLRDATVFMATMLGVSVPVVGPAVAAGDAAAPTSTQPAAPSPPPDDSSTTTTSTTVPDGAPTTTDPAAATTTTTPTTTPDTTSTTTTTTTLPPETVPATTPTTTPATTTPEPTTPAPTDTLPADTVPAETVPADTVPTETVPVDTPAEETVAIPAPTAPLPPTNPIWLQTGDPRAQGIGVPGAQTPELGRTPAGVRHVLVDDIQVILATIRELESHGRYDAMPNRALASGAYQYIPSTWNGYGGYAEAYLAPPEVQDERARLDVERFLMTYGGDVSMIPVMWYFPIAASDPTWMDRVPNPAGGNRLTVREYQSAWLTLLAQNVTAMMGTYVPGPGTPAPVSVLSSIPAATPTAAPTDTATPAPAGAAATLPAAEPADAAPSNAAPADAVPAEAAPADVAPTLDPFVIDQVTVSPGTVDLAARSVPVDELAPHGEGAMRSIVFPVLGPVDYADTWGAPRHGGRSHEGTDIIGVPMQPLLAAVDGIVTRVQYEPLGIAGVVITIQDADGWRYNYFHVNNDTPGTDDGQSANFFRIAPGISLGAEVRAGQIIGYMGDSGNSELSVAHLHFEMRDPEGRAQPSFWSLEAARARQACTIGIGPWSTPVLAANAGSDDPNRLVASTVVVPSTGRGQWVIDSDGRVTATGDAALIMPSPDVDCAPGPIFPFGTDAGGWDAVRSDVLDGTVLEGVDLTGSQLLDVVPPEDPTTPVQSVDPSAASIETADDIPTEIVLQNVPLPSVKWNADKDKAAARMGADIEDLRDPMAFTDPSTGQTILVVFDLGPSIPYVPTPTPPG
jgi:murein DD-endopeptidase MepM/ murein hydrolase activator NlpD